MYQQSANFGWQDAHSVRAAAARGLPALPSLPRSRLIVCSDKLVSFFMILPAMILPCPVFEIPGKAIKLDWRLFPLQPPSRCGKKSKICDYAGPVHSDAANAPPSPLPRREGKGPG
jgi:hypothetical protein